MKSKTEQVVWLTEYLSKMNKEEIIEKLELELDWLEARRIRLCQFLYTPTGEVAIRSEAVSARQWGLLLEQYEFMTQYSRVLAERIKDLEQ